MQTPEQAAAEVVLMTKQHHYIQKELGGKLIFAPVELAGRDLSILDVGCGSGLVLKDLHGQVGAGSHLVGLDINPAALAQGEASAGEKGIKLVQHDMNDPLPEDLKKKFDIVHVRYSIYGGGRSGLAATIKNLTSALESGGWLQVQELNMQSGDGKPGKALSEQLGLFNSLIEKMGIDPKFCDSLVSAFEAAGLGDVSLGKYESKFGKGAKDEAESIEMYTQWIPMLAEYSKMLQLPSPSSDLQERLRAELAETGAAFQRYIVTGRKA